MASDEDALHITRLRRELENERIQRLSLEHQIFELRIANAMIIQLLNEVTGWGQR